MSQAACPRCNESIRVPDLPLPATAMVRCPWCLETFRIEEFGFRLAPLVDLVDEEGRTIRLPEVSVADLARQATQGVGSAFASTAAAATGGYMSSAIDEGDWSAAIDGDAEAGANGFENDSDTFPAQSGSFATELDSDSAAPGERERGPDEHEHELDDQESTEGAVAFGGLPDSSAGDFGGNFAPTQGTIRAARPRKKTPSPIKSVVQMVLGGAVAIPVTGAILWGVQAMGWRNFDFGFYPFDGSAAVAKRTAGAPREIRERDRQRPAGRQLGTGESPFAGGLLGSIDDQPGEFPDMLPGQGQQPPQQLEDEQQGLLDDALAGLGDGMDPQADLADIDLSDMLPSAPGTAGDLLGAQDGLSAQDFSPSLPGTDAAEMGGSDPSPETASVPRESERVQQAISPELTAAFGRVDELSDQYQKGRQANSIDRNLRAQFYEALALVGELGQPEAGESYSDLIDLLRYSDQLDEMLQYGSPWVARAQLKQRGVFAEGTLRKQDDGYLLEMAPVGNQPVSFPLDGWSENEQDPELWLDRKVVVIAKLEGDPGQRQGTIRYLEER